MNRLEARTALVKRTGRYDLVGTKTENNMYVPDYTVDNGADAFLDAAVRRLDEQVKIRANRRKFISALHAGQYAVAVNNLRTVLKVQYQTAAGEHPHELAMVEEQDREYFEHRFKHCADVDEPHVFFVCMDSNADVDINPTDHVETVTQESFFMGNKALEYLKVSEEVDVAITVSGHVTLDIDAGPECTENVCLCLYKGVWPTPNIVAYSDVQATGATGPVTINFNNVTFMTPSANTGWLVAFGFVTLDEDDEITGFYPLISGTCEAELTATWTEVPDIYVGSGRDVRLIPEASKGGILIIDGYWYTAWGYEDADSCWWSVFDPSLMLHTAALELGIAASDENIMLAAKRIEEIKRSLVCDDIATEVEMIGNKSIF